MYLPFWSSSLDLSVGFHPRHLSIFPTNHIVTVVPASFRIMRGIAKMTIAGLCATGLTQQGKVKISMWASCEGKLHLDME